MNSKKRAGNLNNKGVLRKVALDKHFSSGKSFQIRFFCYFLYFYIFDIRKIPPRYPRALISKQIFESLLCRDNLQLLAITIHILVWIIGKFSNISRSTWYMGSVLYISINEKGSYRTWNQCSRFWIRYCKGRFRTKSFGEPWRINDVFMTYYWRINDCYWKWLSVNLWNQWKTKGLGSTTFYNPGSTYDERTSYAAKWMG